MSDVNNYNTTPRGPGDTGAGWIIAVIILLILLIGGYFAFARHGSTTNVNTTGTDNGGTPSDTSVNGGVTGSMTVTNSTTTTTVSGSGTGSTTP